MKNKRLLILPRYTRKGPSSRVRFYQYVPFLQEAGWTVKMDPFFDDAYVEALYAHQPLDRFSLFSAYTHRLAITREASKYNLVWLQYELLPWLPAWIENNLLPGDVPLIIDYDDAIFHRYDMHRSICVRQVLGRKIAHVMENATALTMGNAYLAQWGEKAGAHNILQIPSVVDTDRYQINRSQHEKFTIGWIGTPKTAHYLEMLEPALKVVLDAGTRLLIVGASVPESLQNLPVESQPWGLDTEVQQIQQFDLGIMPLIDEPFERGKCGYKLIQYLACGLPVIASPVGVNREIVEHNVNGFLASTMQEWVSAFKQLKSDQHKLQEFGIAGRKKVESNYSLEKNAPRLLAFFEQLMS